MSVFGTHGERQGPAVTPERRPVTSDFSYEALVQPSTPPRSAAEPAASKASVLGKTLVFRGELSAEEDLVLQGRVEGSIHHTQSLTVGMDGVVIGDIHAANITVEGTVEGNLHGSTSVLIGASAKVHGNIVAPRVGIREGAQFNGAVEMGSAAAARGAAPKAQRSAPPTDDLVMNDRVVDRMLQRS